MRFIYGLSGGGDNSPGQVQEFLVTMGGTDNRPRPYKGSAARYLVVPDKGGVPGVPIIADVVSGHDPVVFKKELRAYRPPTDVFWNQEKTWLVHI